MRKIKSWKSGKIRILNYCKRDYGVPVQDIIDEAINIAVQSKEIMEDQFLKIRLIENISNNSWSNENIDALKAKRGNIAFVYTHNLKKNIIFINFDKFIVKSLHELTVKQDQIKKLALSMAEIIIHEITHLKHAKINNIFKKKHGRSDKYNEIFLNIKFGSKLRNNFGKLIDARTYILILFLNFITEGLADFNRMYTVNKLDVTRESVLTCYAKAEEDAKKLANGIDDMLNILKQDDAPRDDVYLSYKQISNFTYSIGCHIIQTILTFNSDSIPDDLHIAKTSELMNEFKYAVEHDIEWKYVGFKELLGMNYSKIIKLYERACEKLDIHPLVSFKDKNAIFVYYDILKELREIKKQYKNQYKQTD